MNRRIMEDGGMMFLAGVAISAAIVGSVWLISKTAPTEIRTPSLCVKNGTVSHDLQMLGLEERVVWAEKDGTYRVLWVLPSGPTSGSQWVLVMGDPGGECTMRRGGLVKFLPSSTK